MAICNDNFNGCYGSPYYPRPIFNCGATGTCGGGNNIVNPAQTGEWGFFATQSNQVSSLGVIPVNTVSKSGSAISQDQAGVINITSGNYLVNYSANLNSNANPVEIALELNGEILPYSSISQSGNGDLKTLFSSVIVSASSNSIIKMLNQTNDDVVILNANLVVTKLLN